MNKLKHLMDDPHQFGAHVLRLAFAFLFILVAVKKLRMGYGGFAESLVMGDTLFAKEMPSFILYIYGYIIPALELIAGILLLLNKKTKLAYQAIGLIYLSFVFGQQYDGNTSKVGIEYLPSLVALTLAYYLDHKTKHSS